MYRSVLMAAGFAVVAAAAVACGDNSAECGPGTTNVDGVCTGGGSGSGTCGSGTTNTNGVCVPNCTDGTMFDPTQGCVFDPGQCHDGTVYIAGKGCVDPTAGLVVNVDEGAEPNGLGIVVDHSTQDPLEANATVPAGQLTIQDIGQTEVVHGYIKPFQDEDGDGIPDGDADAYTVHVSQPTLVNIAIDGIGGVEGGMVAVEALTGPSDPLAPYRRELLNIDGDTATRQMLFPAAGDYAIVVCDSRTLEIGGPFGGSAAEYYMSISQVAMPTTGAVFAVDSSGSGGGSDAGTVAATAVQVYQVQMGLGFNTVRVSTTTTLEFTPDLVVYNNGVFQAEAQQDFFDASTVTAGYAATDTTLVIVDPIVDLSPAAPYEVDVQTSVDAKPFCATDCSAAPQTAAEGEVQNAPPIDTSGFQPVLDRTQFALLNTWFYDTTAANESDAFALSFDRPLDGVWFDVNGNVVDLFTAYSGNTITGYSGQLRLPTAGRYYFVAYDPTGTPGTTTVTATTQLQAQTPVALTFGAQTDAQTVNFANSNLFSYAADANANPWQTFSAQSTKTGNVTAHVFDPTTAFGRLDPLVENTTATGGGSNVALSPDALELFTMTLPESNVGIGHILLDDTTTNYLITTTAAVTANAPSFKLGTAARAFVDLGTENAADAALTTHETNQANNQATFFLLRTTAGNQMLTQVAPQGALKPDVELDSVNNDESLSLELGPSTLGASESGALPSHDGGWLAFAVTPTGLTGTGAYDVTNSVVAGTGYGSASVNATFTELTQTVKGVTTCSGGSTTVAFTGDQGFLANDEGLSDLIATPAGFEYFGADIGAFRVSTNGFLTFDADVDSAAGVCVGSDGTFDTLCAVALPDPGAPNAIVAPLWTDLVDVTACTKITGQTETIEWVGLTVGGFGILDVKFEVQLDALTDQITFLYDGSTEDSGGDASIGLEDYAGGSGVSVSFDTDGGVTIPGAIRFNVQ